MALKCYCTGVLASEAVSAEFDLGYALERGRFRQPQLESVADVAILDERGWDLLGNILSEVGDKLHNETDESNLDAISTLAW